MKLLIFALLVATCSKPPREDTPLPVPSESPTPKPPIPPPPPPTPPPPPEDTESTVICSTAWQLTDLPKDRKYDITYTVTKTLDKTVQASFKAVYQAGSLNLTQDETSFVYKPGHLDYDKAKVTTIQWKASLEGTRAVFERVHTNETREVLCNML